MKKTIILLFAMCIAFSCAAQTFTITQLKGCKWVTYDREKETNTIWFTDPRADGYVPTKLMCRLICNLPELSIRIFNPLASYF